MAKQVLIVDDEQGFRDLFAFILSPLGFEITCVENGQEAVEKVAEKSFDVILMDVHMPILTGPQALKKIREIRPAQKVIILSSGSDAKHLLEDESEKLGNVVCLYKPVEIAELQQALEEALGPLPQPI